MTENIQAKPITKNKLSMIDSSSPATIASNGTFSAIAAAFVMQSLAPIIGWLFVMTAIVVCDLLTAGWRCVKTDEEFRFSKACRDTMAKIVVYYSVVVAACLTGVAAEAPDIAKYTCLFICLIEFVSIIGNILKTHGIVISLNDVVKVFVRRTANIAKEDADEIFKKG